MCIRDSFKSLSINQLNLLPAHSWKEKIISSWNVGENAAKNRLNEFVETEIEGYKEGRNFPSKKNVSRLSPYLHWGEISPNSVWYAAKDRMDAGFGHDDDCDHFLSELGWREFSHALLYYFPNLPRQNLQPRFDKFAWKDDADALHRWQRGKTGYPIVDAAMRQLRQTGYMHNRLRMIVGSFLVKNLRLHWHHGEAWFWDCLVDADLANNSASWQWIAGCGADAAPYFRIFNPVRQAERFDPDGTFVRSMIPELAGADAKQTLEPWKFGGVGDYPKPMIDLSEARDRTLSVWKIARNGG